MNTQIEQALHNFRNNARAYSRLTGYYDGRQDLRFASEKFTNTFGSLFREFALNLCSAVCDSVRDKLKIDGFTAIDHAHYSTGTTESNTKAIWHRNRMEIRAAEVHKEALTAGDAYVIVWSDAEGSASIFPNSAASVTVAYDDESPGEMLWAAKLWKTAAGSTRLNLFYPDRIERFVDDGSLPNGVPDASRFMPFRTLGESDHTIANPFGRVPLFHFANNASIGAFGRSELEDAIPIQDGLNKSVLDMLVAMEFSAFRQRWAAGIEMEYDELGNPKAPFKAGIDHLWITENKDARFGDFDPANLEQFLKVKDGFRIDMASVTGTPLYYLLPHGRAFQSGEALRKAESRFIAKVRDRQTAFGRTWADVMEFALTIEGRSPTMVETRWEDPARLTEREELENLRLRKELGLAN